MFILLVASLVTGSVTTPQPLALPDARFRYTTTAVAGSPATRLLTVQPLKNDRSAQQIKLTGLAAVSPAANVHLQDVNFDGQPDLVLTVAQGNVNSQYDYWLYQPQKQQFVRNAQFSKLLGGYEIIYNKQQQEITTSARFSCCEYEHTTYAYKGGQLKLLRKKTEASVDVKK